MGKWTPGPWVVVPAGQYAGGVEIEASGNPLAVQGRSERAKVNRRLIAEAPAMAEALEQTAAAMDALHPSSAGDMSDADYARLWNATRDALEAILARINGDAP